jgi:hypothetical protein
MKKIKNHFGLFILILWLFLPLLKWSDIRFLIHDNLDSIVVWAINLIRYGKLTSGPLETMDHVFDKLPRLCFQSEYDFYILLFYLFKPKIAYLINYILIHIFAYTGMFLLINSLFKFKKKYMPTTISLLYALLPFWPSGGLSVAGLPLLMYVYCRLFNNIIDIKAWIVVILYSFYSSFILSNVWIVSVLIPTLITLYFIEKNSNFLKLLIPTFVFLIIGILIEYRLFLNLFLYKIPSQRTLLNIDVLHLNYKGVLNTWIRLLLFGHYHFHSVNFLITLFVLFTLFFMYFKRIAIKLYKYVLLIAFLIFLVTFIAAIQSWDVYVKITNNTIFDGLNIRTITVYPLLWFLMLIITLKKIEEYNIRFLINFSNIFLILYFIQLFFNIKIRDYYGSVYTENLFVQTYLMPNNQQYLKWEEFYDEKEISSLYSVIPKGTKLLVIDASPEIFQYNGFKTCNSYQGYIPLSSYLNFQKIFDCKKNQLKINRRCEIFSNELTLNKCELNKFILKNKFNCNHVVSKNELPLSSLELILKTKKYYLYKIK